MEKKENNSNKKNYYDKIISLIIDFIYSKDKKYSRYLFLLLVFGFIIRLFAALNLNVLADDMVHVSQSAGIMSAKILSTHSNPPLFYYLTDLSFHIFGYTTFASRFFPLICGTLLILLVYLFSMYFFNNQKIALFSSIFVTFSSFLVRNTFGEASLIVLFFSMFGIYLGLLYLKEEKLYFLILSAVCFGIGMLLKYNTPFFILSFLLFSLFYLYSKKKKIFTKKNLFHLSLFILIIILFSLPFITFNYLLFKDKQIMDVYFSRIIQTQKTQELYGGLAGQGNSIFNNLFIISNYGNINTMLRIDLIIFVLSILGLSLLTLKKQYKVLIFLLLSLIIPFILQSAGAPLPKHFVFMPFLLAIPAGFFLESFSNTIKEKYKTANYFNILLGIIIILLIYNLGVSYGNAPNFSSPSGASQLKSYIHDNVNEDDLIVLDARIYTSQSFWLATPNHFINPFQFVEFYNYHQNLSSNYKVPTNVYFIQCVSQDCGWGTVHTQEQLNQSSIYLYQDFEKNFPQVKEITESVYSGNEFISSSKISKFKVYKASIPLNPLAVKQTDLSNAFYFVPYMYKNMDSYLLNYEIHSTFDRVLNTISYYIIYFALFFTLCFILFFLFLIYNSLNKNPNKNEEK